ncbi:hypothetical protein KUTeg_022470 [Tegillarca granosa]|uniref:Rab-GAP TBC domain-containing protein n=1 Tax=Tegillarca granosa TaxID=220873 RepID=A0ABQ9E6A2_TEGGR|nr:hypothetical protein KUTeg_022470 [Tegillarca granosa]
MAAFRARLKEYEDILNEDVIDMKRFRKLCFNGCPFESGYRSICWKKQRELYRHFVEDLIVKPGTDAAEGAQVDDHIDKDCRRLCPDLFFFQRATDYPCKELINADSRVETLRKRVEQCLITSRRRASEEYMVLKDGQEAHWEVVERILFIYAKLNPGQEYAEADSFFCFTNLMGEIRDIFIKTLDLDSHCGSLMAKLMSMLKEKDEALWHRIEELGLKPQYFAFRWITLLLSQEFPLPDVLRIWDSLFAYEDRFHFLICICCAMLMLLRMEIIQGDFPTSMKLLQNFNNTKLDLQTVLSKAVEF